MAFDQGLDLDFQFLSEQDFFHENSEKGIDNNVSDWVNVDSLFEPESTDPLFGNDLSLASTVNFSSDDDLLACAQTDVYPSMEQLTTKQGPQESQVKRIQVNHRSPWNESDSGMSDTTSTPSASPQRSFQDDQSMVVKSTREATLKLKSNDVLNVTVEDLDFDFDQCQYSPSSSCTASPPHFMQDPKVDSRASMSLVDELITERDMQQKRALEFFDSTDMFSETDNPKALKLVKIQQEVPEDKSRKNAIQAKINREKKKAYIKSLEDEIAALRKDNTKLKSENQRMQNNTADLEEEVEYLKSILVNSSSLSSLLRNISDVKEVKLSATVLSKKRSVTDDHSYNFIESVPEKRARRINENLKKAGVCLHVNGESACLEFCAHCSKLAQKSCI